MVEQSTIICGLLIAFGGGVICGTLICWYFLEQEVFEKLKNEVGELKAKEMMRHAQDSDKR